MLLDHLQGKKVLVVGLGESGLAMAQFCLQSGANVSVCDTRNQPPGLKQLQEQSSSVAFVPALEIELLQGVDLLAWSPGLSLSAPDHLTFLNAAALLNLKPLGEAQIFSDALAVLKERFSYAPKVLAITGTNGKTTTTMLTAHLCQCAGLDAVAAGNVSPSMLTVLSERLAENHLPQVWVLELSSFQLATLNSLPCDAATVLNLSQDHLDWHVDMADYVAAKHRIYAAAQVMIFNRDDSKTEPLAPKELNKKIVLAPEAKLVAKAEAEAQLQRFERRVSFGTQEPSRVGDFGLQLLNGVPWLIEAVPTEDEMPGRKRAATAKSWLNNKLMPVEVLPLLGEHNLANVLAALALCRSIGTSYAKLLRGLTLYKGEPHRCQRVRELDGVVYVDDSKGTNVGATVAALKGLTGVGLTSRVVLIAGGEGKGQDFAPLAEAVVQYARHVLLIGRDADTIRAAIQLELDTLPSASTITLHNSASLEEAVFTAQSLAVMNDAVLLSPACASFDMFDNYEHRAEVFVSAVHRLQAMPIRDDAINASVGTELLSEDAL